MRVLVIGLAVTGEAVVRHRALAGRRRDGAGGPSRCEPRLAGPCASVPASRARRSSRRRRRSTRAPSEPRPTSSCRARASRSVTRRSPPPGGTARPCAPRSTSPPTSAAGRRSSPSPGTNGKTTVTTLAADDPVGSGPAHRRRGQHRAAAPRCRPRRRRRRGRRGVVVPARRSHERFAPRAAALLNLAADHLDWHRTFDAYARAKAQVFARQGPDDLLVFNADDPVVAGLAAGAPARRVPFSVAAGAAEGARLVDTVRGRLLVTQDGQEIAARRGPAQRGDPSTSRTRSLPARSAWISARPATPRAPR